MPTYVVAGASRGLGLQFVLDFLARGDVVVALARDPENSKGLQVIKDNKNLLIVKADITDLVSLNNAVEETTKYTGGAIDVLVNNAVYQGTDSQFCTLIDFPSPESLTADLVASFATNVVGPVQTTNAFLPLLRNGKLKKVISLSTGLAIPELVMASGIPKVTSYAITKCALEMVNVKYALALKEEGFIFLAISPGVVDTSTEPPTEEHTKEVMQLAASFKATYPDWTGPTQPSESVAMMLKVIDNLKPEDSGKFLSHKGNREFL